MNNKHKSMRKNNALEQIRVYLEGRAAKDELFAEMYKKESKSLDGCFGYILEQAKKRGTSVCMTDEEVYGLAVHYYCEDDIKTRPLPRNLKVSTCHVDRSSDNGDLLTEEEKKRLKDEAEKEYKERCMVELKKEEEKRLKKNEKQRMDRAYAKAMQREKETVGMGGLFDF